MEPPLPASIGRLVAVRQLKEVANVLRDQRAAAVSGLWGASVAAVIAAIRAEAESPYPAGLRTPRRGRGFGR